MVETTLPNGLETSGQRVYRLFWHISRRFWVFPFRNFYFRFLPFFVVFVYSWSTLLWYRCYYAHRSRDSMSPVCGICLTPSLSHWLSHTLPHCPGTAMPKRTQSLNRLFYATLGHFKYQRILQMYHWFKSYSDIARFGFWVALRRACNQQDNRV